MSNAGMSKNHELRPRSPQSSARGGSISSATTRSVGAISIQPAENFAALLERHRQCVKQAANEMSQQEEKRAVRFERAQTAAERAMLEKRFAMERDQDQVKLQRITKDYDLVRQAVARGDLPSALVEARKELGKKPVLGKLDLEHNRFVGDGTTADVVQFESGIKMFERTDRKFQLKQQPKFDPYPVQKNIQLLKQKKDILHQLISVQTKEMRARAAEGATATYAPASSRAWKDTSSVFSDATTSSRASWATFASSSSSSARGGLRPGRRPPAVPRLKLN